MTGKSSVASENPSEPELEQEQEQEHVSLSSSSYESSPVNARVSFPGNRISVSGDGWNGWSSAFSPEANQSRLVESTGGAETTDGGLTASMQASFGTLLMRYGVGSQAPSASPVGQPPPPGNIGTTSSGIIEVVCRFLTEITQQSFKQFLLGKLPGDFDDMFENLNAHNT